MQAHITRLGNTCIVIVSVVFLAAFTLLSKYEDRAVMREFDFAATVRIQEKIDRSAHLRTSAFIGTVFDGSVYFASPVFTVIVTLFASGIAFFGPKGKRRNLHALFMPIGLVMIVLAELYGKGVVHHPPPPFMMIKNPTTVFPDAYVSAESSFPSGHAARAVFLAIALYSVISQTFHMSGTKRLVLSVVLGAYVFLVSVSKVYLGHHWVSDVIGGLCIGLGFGLPLMNVTMMHARRDHPAPSRVPPPAG